MSILRSIPHTARYLSPVTQHQAIFIAGQYTFPDTFSTVFAYQPNTVYLIERIAISANFSGETYLEAIPVSGIPLSIDMRQSIGQFKTYYNNMTISNFQQRDTSIWTISDKRSNNFIARVVGVLDQTPAMIGLQVIYISIAWDIYAIDEKDYNSAFRNTITSGYANSVRGGI